VGKLSEDGESAFLQREAFAGLVGERATDAEWRAGLRGMVAYAADNGWVDKDGRVQAHIERGNRSDQRR
jgi:hypothetical protein